MVEFFCEYFGDLCVVQFKLQCYNNVQHDSHLLQMLLQDGGKLPSIDFCIISANYTAGESINSLDPNTVFV